jgi:hypothetical protein
VLATFNNISVVLWRSDLLVGENNRPAASQPYTSNSSILIQVDAFFSFVSIKRDKRRDSISFGDSQNMVVGFTSTYAFRAYHHQRCEFESRSCNFL